MTLLFCILLLAIIYVYLGYPLALMMIDKNKKEVRNKPDGCERLTITAVVVACNESHNIKNKINNILELDYPEDKLNIIFVDDASTDDTLGIVKGIESKRISIIEIEERNGKASGLNRAFKDIKTDLVLLLDARQKISNNSAKDLASWFETYDEAGAISGELLFADDGANNVSEGMDGYWKYEKYIRKTEAHISSVPGVTGAIYMMRTGLFQNIPDDTILDDVLIPMNVVKQGYWVGFDDRAKAWDIPSSDLAKEKSRKIRTIKGNYQLWFRNLSFAMPMMHPIWWQYLSHKVLRLLCPYIALLTIFLGIYLAQNDFFIGYVYSLGLVIALSLYPISLFFNNLLTNKLLRIWISFVALNWFNMLGLYHYLFDKKQNAWKK